MNEQNKKMELLGRAPVAKALLAMGIPTMLGMMINALYNIVDAYFVGSLGTSQMGAISIVYPLGQAVVGLGLLFGNGAASYIARLLGHGNRETADKVASTALYGSISAGMVFIVCALLFLEPLLRILGATESILPYAASYAGIYITASIFNIFNVTMNNLVTSEGAAKMTMCVLMVGAVLNIVLDPLFINEMHWGVVGAAAATAVSQVVTAFMYLWYIYCKKSVFHFRIKDCTFSREILTEISKIGVPTLVFQILTSLSIALINLQAKDYGDAVIAGMGIAVRVISMGSLMVFGFIKGFQPIAGYSYGAKDDKRLRMVTKTVLVWSTIFCVVYGLAIVFGAGFIVSWFTSGDMEMAAIGKEALRANGVSFFLFGGYTVYSSLFLALGKGREGFFLGACRQGICFVPVILLLPTFWGMNGILYAQPAADVLSAAATVIMAVRLRRELDRNRA